MEIKFSAVLDDENFRYIIRPLHEDGSMGLSEAIRIIKKRTNVTWRELRDFFGLPKQTDVFKLAYVHNAPMSRHPLKDFLVIDAANNCAFLYDADHKPEGVIPPHVGPTLTNGERRIEIVERVPAKVVSRLTVKDPLDRMLVMSLTPTNGYLLGLQARSLAIPGMTYSVSGTCAALNKLLRSVFFVGTEAGDASVVVKVDDGAGDVASVVSTTVTLTVIEATTLSVPDIILPASPRVETGKYMGFEPITVEDADGKLMEFRMSVYGCYVTGFNSFLHALTPGKVKNIYGRPEDINEDISNLQVFPFTTNAQIGMELICGNTRIRKYLVLDVSGEPCQPPKVHTNDHILYGDDQPFSNPNSTGTVPVTEAGGSPSDDPSDQPQEPDDPENQGTDPDPGPGTDPLPIPDPMPDPVPDPDDGGSDTPGGGGDLEPDNPTIHHEDPIVPTQTVGTDIFAITSQMSATGPVGEEIPIEVVFSGSSNTRHAVDLAVNDDGNTSIMFKLAVSGDFTEAFSLENNIPTLNNKIQSLVVRGTQPGTSQLKFYFTAIDAYGATEPAELIVPVTFTA